MTVVIQQGGTTVSTSSTTSIGITAGQTFVENDVAFVCLSINSASVSVSSVSDPNGNTWTFGEGWTQGTIRAEVWKCAAVNASGIASGHTITVNFTAAVTKKTGAVLRVGYGGAALTVTGGYGDGAASWYDGSALDYDSNPAVPAGSAYIGVLAQPEGAYAAAIDTDTDGATPWTLWHVGNSSGQSYLGVTYKGGEKFGGSTGIDLILFGNQTVGGAQQAAGVGLTVIETQAGNAPANRPWPDDPANQYRPKHRLNQSTNSRFRRQLAWGNRGAIGNAITPPGLPLTPHPGFRSRGPGGIQARVPALWAERRRRSRWPRQLRREAYIAPAATDYTRTIDDLLGIVDAASRVAGYARSSTDPVGLLDAASRVAAYARTSSDTVGIVDDAARVAAYARSSTDALGIVDDLARVAGYARTISDTVGLVDALEASLGFARTVTDTVGLVDALEALLVMGREITDTVGIVDDATRVVDFVRSVSDPVGLLDDLARVAGLSRTATDTVGLVDDATRVVAFSRTISDVVGLLDALTAAIGYNVSISDALGIVDDLARAVLYVVVLGDPVGIVDDASRIAGYVREATDTVGLVDVVDRVVGAVREITDTVGLVDLLATVAVVVREITDPVGLLDDSSAATGFLREISDPVGLLDAVDRLVSREVEITDSVGVVDDVARVAAIIRVLTDALGTVDSATAVEILTRVLGVLARPQMVVGAVTTDTDASAVAGTSTGEAGPSLTVGRPRPQIDRDRSGSAARPERPR